VTVNAHKKSLTLTYQNQTVEIQLLDNPFVHKWACHLEKMLGEFSHKHFFTSYPYLFPSRSLSNQSSINQYATDLAGTVLQLRELNVGFPENFEIEETKNLDITLQQKLNRLHRYFTWCNRDDIGKNLFWGPGQPVTGSRDQKILEKINQITNRMNVEIHKLEAYVATPNKIKLLRSEFTELEIMFDTHVSPEISGEMKTGSWHSIESKDFQYLSNDPTYDMWVPIQILGKPYHVAYYDHDDPVQWDITHPIGYSGNFAVSVTGNKAHHMSNTDVIKWLKSYEIEPGPATCGMPLGRITLGKEYLCQWQRQWQRQWQKNLVKDSIDSIVVELQ
jgi:hypothetical protein